jgi:hypothetical protein
MALAARRDPAARAADVRTACPVCGGAIHPVAGRCKHCRADLVKLRAQYAAGHAGSGALPAPPPFPVPTAPVMLGAPPSRTWWRRWPLVVTIVAAAAILVCVALLMTGESRSEPRLRRSAVPPMDRMDTDPLPERLDRTDPWKRSDPGVDRPVDPDPAQPPPRDPDSPWPPPDTPDTPTPDPSQTGAGGPRADEFFAALTRTACRRLTSCGIGSLGGAAITDACEQIGASALDVDLAARLRSGQCRYDDALAASCLRAIEQAPCSAQTMDFDELARQWMSMADCGGALRCP